MSTEAMFHATVFDQLETALELLLDGLRTTYGAEFSTSDLKWHEKLDHKTLLSEATLLWKKTPVLELTVHSPSLHCRCLLKESAYRH